MTSSSPQEATPPGRAPPYAEKVWTVHLRTAIRTPAEGWPFMQLPPGEYKLYEHADVCYELRMSNEFSCYFSSEELHIMRTTGEVVIDGSWPQ